MKIEAIKFDEIMNAGNLIKDVFNEFVAADFPEKAIISFYEIIKEDSIRDRFYKGNTILLAKTDNEIAGYIEMSGMNHIYLLFVKKEFQKKGIAGMLIHICISLIKKNSTELNRITVNSTFSAVKIYEKLGFRKIADFQLKNGVTSFPMSFDI